MKYPEQGQVLLHQMRLLPLSWLSLSRGRRWLLVACSYGLGVGGLWLFFPPTHNGASMYLPIACACWLFRYWGLFASLLLNGIAFQFTYLFLLRGLLPDSAFVEGALIGLGTSLLIGLVVCWLRTAVDAAQLARQQAIAAEHARALTELQERQAILAYEHERKINVLKEQFLLNVSHELRTPLTVLAGFLDLLVEHDEHLDPQTRLNLLKNAVTGQEELTVLVEQILDATRVAGDLPGAKPEIVNVHELLDQVLALLAPASLSDYTLRLEVGEQVTVWADPQFLQQVLRNLLSNICKYVPTHTEVRIEATHSNDRSLLCLSIQDAGPGIPADELPLLFEKFVRLKRDRAGSTGGTGLGLYICKQMVEAMGGRIWVESSGRPGEGSRFCLTLPVSSPETLLPSKDKRFA